MQLLIFVFFHRARTEIFKGRYVSRDGHGLFARELRDEWRNRGGRGEVVGGALFIIAPVKERERERETRVCTRENMVISEIRVISRRRIPLENEETPRAR